MQLQAVLGLQVDHQTVGQIAVRAKDGVRCRAKIDDDARIAPGQAFAGADVERHARPAPVGNFGAQRDKGFGVAMRVDASFFAVTGHFDTAAGATGILAAHHVLRQRLLCPGFE